MKNYKGTIKQFARYAEYVFYKLQTSSWNDEEKNRWVWAIAYNHWLAGDDICELLDKLNISQEKKFEILCPEEYAIIFNYIGLPKLMEMTRQGKRKRK